MSIFWSMNHGVFSNSNSSLYRFLKSNQCKQERSGSTNWAWIWRRKKTQDFLHLLKLSKSVTNILCSWDNARKFLVDFRMVCRIVCKCCRLFRCGYISAAHFQGLFQRPTISSQMLWYHQIPFLMVSLHLVGFLFSSLKCRVKAVKNLKLLSQAMSLCHWVVNIPAPCIHKQPNFIQSGYKSLQNSSAAQSPDITVHK